MCKLLTHCLWCALCFCFVFLLQDAMRESVEWFVENYDKPGTVRGVNAPGH